jgi:signal transduction histidine kinase
MKNTQRRERFTLTLVISLFIFVSMFLSMVIVGAVAAILLHFDLLQIGKSNSEVLTIFVFLLILASTVLGSILSWLVVRMPLGLINTIINALNSLARGEFGTRIHLTRWYEKKMQKLWILKDLTDSFNSLASELENTEMLRSDFVNNFSHEFKTPIVSIAGFAKLLKRGQLSEEQRIEYLDIIEEESRRLSVMATNVLDLTKVENQTILTDAAEFNLSEQLRNCVLLLERKWERKKLDIELEFDEISLRGSEELLKQVWINLLDNAIKFSDDNGTVRIAASRSGDAVEVAVENGGQSIPAGSMEKIFRKFYQADESHAAEGNGVGLAVVKRVVELHGGRVEAVSGDGMTVFTVTLPAYPEAADTDGD